MAALFQQMLCKKCSVAKIELIEEIVNTSIKGINFSYQKKYLFCHDCEEQYETPSLLDENEKNRKCAYLDAKETSGEITKEYVINLINNILQKYDIGKKPLARLLGWSDATIMRYTSKSNQSLPLNDYLKTLNEIYTDPAVFEELYSKKKDELAPIAQSKIEIAIQNLSKTKSEKKLMLLLNILQTNQ